MEACLFISCAKYEVQAECQACGGDLVSPHPLVAKSSVLLESIHGGVF